MTKWRPSISPAMTSTRSGTTPSHPEHQIARLFCGNPFKDGDGDPGFDLLGRAGVRAQGVADDALVSTHRSLHPGPRIVARGFLPAHPALLGNGLDVAVALGWIGVGR